MVLIPKQNKKKILEHVFKEGVIVVKHDPRACRHNELEDIPNLHVMMVMKSLCSRAYVTEKFNWQWHYYFLTNEGIEYLREVLHLPAQVFPSTLTKQRPSRPALAGADTAASGDGGGWGKGKGKGKWGGDGYGKGYGKGE
eukprot:CAMPEP_0179103896 /NCGR_PEP_ID=MMETSP0796-20121207/48164_1 /TAXON_ID=73915 /ORGANISM="Pyrodinium bahamense, Strain pbaha01" /LENGTH=139 /DNA_ID=CAMNT_0020801817 /DNA_START=93 /DNA_END=512 /DNA_ORIENTATION=+